MARLPFLAGSLVLISGCATEAPPPRSAPIPADLEAWIANSTPLTVGGDPPRPPAQPLTTKAIPLSQRAADGRRDDDAPRLRSHHIAAPVEHEPRPRGRARVDVSFQGADMVSAFQFLADAGRFNVVLGEGLGGKVSATLRGVDPYDALVSLAEANGAVVKFDHQIVVISKK